MIFVRICPGDWALLLLPGLKSTVYGASPAEEVEGFQSRVANSRGCVTATAFPEARLFQAPYF